MYTVGLASFYIVLLRALTGTYEYIKHEGIIFPRKRLTRIPLVESTTRQASARGDGQGDHKGCGRKMIKTPESGGNVQ